MTERPIHPECLNGTHQLHSKTARMCDCRCHIATALDDLADSLAGLARAFVGPTTSAREETLADKLSEIAAAISQVAARR